MNQDDKESGNEMEIKKHYIMHQTELAGFNSNFLTPDNMRWFLFVLNWLPDVDEPLVFLPCGSANKTREKFGKKMISQGMCHQFLSAVTRYPGFERVILSEPLTIIPYKLEDHDLRPDYNLPPEDLSIQSERIFINQLALWLAKVKLAQPNRVNVYYIGAVHHYFILYFANQVAGHPFTIIHEIPAGGIKGFGEAAKHFHDIIIKTEETGVASFQEPVSLAKVVKSRGRYTNRKFWREVIMEQLEGKEDFIQSTEEVTSRDEAINGFIDLYLQEGEA